ncbi:glycosyl hydrolases family 28 domain-containing protein [Trichoderma breve]|uniref:galacturonan 1,4-alpha-galacturonidase n=1 Tax=Trichoderma breve TaxID=2034170 RepID=A0A9W9E5P9_9HYPO|nr:glycosyl hydrolases family 28 domain-containing protein [Trichoderma breve]KAJ4855621.1 glycosyl hydrolases family 28 domain-containing protein [Trichoderma breve]
MKLLRPVLWALTTAFVANAHSLPSPQHTCVIPALKDGRDDAPAIREAFSKCGNNGKVVFQKDTTYSVQTALQLHNLKNVQVDLFGTLEYSTDVRYWILHGSYYYFQNISIAMEFSGEDITIDGHGSGTIDGQGQVWYDLALGVGGLYGRPIPFCLRNVKNAVAKNFQIVQSGKWNFVMLESQNVLVDNITLSSTSDDFQVQCNLGNTDGFDTINSNNITIQNSWANVGDDCVSFKPGSTNIHYEGVRDVVENITAEDVSLYGSRNGAYIKTYVGKRTYWPPQGGGGGNGYVRNVVFKNFHIENITASPVLIQQCTHWAGYNVPACADTPPTGFFSNISWSNFTGYMNEKVGTKAISWTCSPLATCEGFSFKDINVKSSTGANGTYSCTNVVGYNSACQKTN